MTSALIPPDGLFTVTAAHTTATTTDEASSTWPLFPATSKYHRNRDGLTKRRRWLVVDFDGTCTEQDTTPLLPYLAAYAAARQRLMLGNISSMSDMETNIIHEQNKRDLEHRLELFQSLENEFVKRYNTVMASLSLLRCPPCSSTNDDDDDDDDHPSQGGKGLIFDGQQQQQQQQQQQKSIHDILHVLDEASTIVTSMVSESKVLDGLGNLSVSEIEQMVQLYGGVNLLSNDTAERQVGEKTNNSELQKVIIRLREGCVDTLSRILATTMTTKTQNSRNSNNEYVSPLTCLGWNLAVLSINWCPALIDTALVQPVIMKTQVQQSSRTSTIVGDESSCSKIEVPIWSNTVDGLGVISLNIPGSAAKRECIIELRRQLLQQQTIVTDAHAERRSSSRDYFIIYIGDSPTDLSALLEADVGIIIGKSNSTNSVISLYSYIEMVSIQQSYDNLRGISILDSNRSENKHILWQADSWKEINDALIHFDEFRVMIKK